MINIDTDALLKKIDEHDAEAERSAREYWNNLALKMYDNMEKVKACLEQIKGLSRVVRRLPPDVRKRFVSNRNTHEVGFCDGDFDFFGLLGGDSFGVSVFLNLETGKWRSDNGEGELAALREYSDIDDETLVNIAFDGAARTAWRSRTCRASPTSSTSSRSAS